VLCRIKNVAALSFQADPISAWQAENQIGTIPAGP